MKKLFVLLAAMVIVFTLAACGGSQAETYEIAMITDAGDIDDESFNQGTWEGIVAYAEENNISHRYYRPAAVSDADYIATIDLAVSAGAKVVVTPGFLFEVAIYEAQQAHPDVKFILIDGVPHAGDWDGVIADNTVSILFAEHESGFLAGYAAVQDGYTALGFMGGMAVPAVVRFGVGFVAGAYYAANEMGQTISFPNNRYEYLGDFDAKDSHKNQALSWFNSGTEIIFAAAGGAGSSVMSAAEDSGNKMIGVDVDQSSISPSVVTSAMKDLGVAVQQVLAQFYAGAFPGGQLLIKDASEDGVALPMENSRFATFNQAQYDVIHGRIASGAISVPENYTELIAFLSAIGQTTEIQQGTIHP